MNEQAHQQATYQDKLHKMNDEELFKECEMKIWLSAYAANNPRSNYHWQCDATYKECQRRNKPDIYSRAHQEAKRV